MASSKKKRMSKKKSLATQSISETDTERDSAPADPSPSDDMMPSEVKHSVQSSSETGREGDAITKDVAPSNDPCEATPNAAVTDESIEPRGSRQSSVVFCKKLLTLIDHLYADRPPVPPLIDDESSIDDIATFLDAVLLIIRFDLGNLEEFGPALTEAGGQIALKMAPTVPRIPVNLPRLEPKHFGPSAGKSFSSHIREMKAKVLKKIFGKHSKEIDKFGSVCNPSVSLLNAPDGIPMDAGGSVKIPVDVAKDADGSVKIPVDVPKAGEIKDEHLNSGANKEGQSMTATAAITQGGVETVAEEAESDVEATDEANAAGKAKQSETGAVEAKTQDVGAEVDSTRQDVEAEAAEKTEEMKAEVEAKTQEVEAEVEAKKEEVEAEVDAKKQQVEAGVEAKKKEVAAELDAKKQELEAEVQAKKKEAEAAVEAKKQELLDELKAKEEMARKKAEETWTKVKKELVARIMSLTSFIIGLAFAWTQVEELAGALCIAMYSAIINFIPLLLMWRRLALDSFDTLNTALDDGKVELDDLIRVGVEALQEVLALINVTLDDTAAKLRPVEDSVKQSTDAIASANKTVKSVMKQVEDYKVPMPDGLDPSKLDAEPILTVLKQLPSVADLKRPVDEVSAEVGVFLKTCRSDVMERLDALIQSRFAGRLLTHRAKFNCLVVVLPLAIILMFNLAVAAFGVLAKANDADVESTERRLARNKKDSKDVNWMNYIEPAVIQLVIAILNALVAMVMSNKKVICKRVNKAIGKGEVILDTRLNDLVQDIVEKHLKVLVEKLIVKINDGFSQLTDLVKLKMVPVLKDTEDTIDVSITAVKAVQAISSFNPADILADPVAAIGDLGAAVGF
eukprot:TRINITY_DN24946_c0_g1_i1.p1 TRINITY_DN24946_c0_g1~~TRINITY_DN24946_c0_g1_i1.p1  ORF type:complete len:926 (+),score=242.92 TRINITY_DN24946_c0_g1_i1:224-2779(+)